MKRSGKYAGRLLLLSFVLAFLTITSLSVTAEEDGHLNRGSTADEQTRTHLFDANDFVGEIESVLTEQEKSALPSVSPEGLTRPRGAFSTMLQYMIELLGSGAAGILPTLGRLLASLLFCMTVKLLADAFANKALAEIVSFCGTVFCAWTLFSLLDSALSAVTVFLSRLHILLSASTAAMTALYAAGGNEVAGAANSAWLVLLLSLLETLSTCVLAPVVRTLFTVSLLCAVSDAPVLRGSCRLCRNLLTAGLGLISFILSVILAFQSRLSQSADSVAVRTVRFALGRAVPVIGGSLSEAVRTVAAGVGALRGTVGTVGVLAVLLLLSAPAVILLLWRAVLAVLQVVCDGIGLSAEAALFTDVSAVLGFLLACVALCAMVSILMFWLFLSATPVLSA